MGAMRCARVLFLALVAVLCRQAVQANGLDWPTNKLLPAFSTPAAVLDCIDVTSVSSVENDLFTSLQGIVNRSQPRIACVVGGQEGAFTWLNLHNLPYTLVNGYTSIMKYRTNVAGLVVTDPAQPHTLNLATTIAGVNSELICDPSLLSVLTNAPYSLPINHDLRGQFTDQYQVYRYLYTNYWPQCTHRILAGMDPNVHGVLREYLVATKCATVWLDPATLNFTDQSVLGMFTSQMTPAQGLYVGWWPNEGNGLNWIYQYGIPVLASDYMVNASVFSGVLRSINVPEIPPPPPLQNKVYVSLILSDGDNIQYMQHAMKLRWDDSTRGKIPIGWTVSPLAADMDPVMLNFYWSTATRNDCLISGPSGAGYTHMQRWSAANLAAFAKVSQPYLERSGARVITIWDQVTAGIARAFATNCPTLLGLTDQTGGPYTSVNLGLCSIGLAPAYSSSTTDIISGITNAAKNWNGSAPLFLAAQAVVWNLTPTDLNTVASALDTNKYILVRPDHLFLLIKQISGHPLATATSARDISPSSATLEGFVVPNATNATAWFEWGTNAAYGTRTLATNVSGNSVVLLRTAIGGLNVRTIYHYRLLASNALGVVYGSDKQFATGERLKSWGQGNLGQTNPPAGLTNVVSVAGGDDHGLALKNDGSVVSWGLNSSGQANVPLGLGNVVAVAGGTQHSLALTSNGTVVAWGDGSSGQTNVPSDLSNIVAIAAGGSHNLALKMDGKVTAWGDNSFGQTNVPVTVTNVVAIAAGFGHSVALKADGSIIAWGYNNHGQTNVPSGLSHITALAVGQNNSLAIKGTPILSSNLQPISRWVADTLSGVDGSAIGNWVDVVAGKTATQTMASRQPRLYANALNGHKIVRFASGGSQYLTVASTNSAMSAAGSFSLVMVFKTSSPGNPSSLFYQNTGLLGCEQPNVVADWALCLNGSQLGAGLGAGSSGCGSDLSLYGGNVTDGKPHIAIYQRSGDTVNLLVDGVIVAGQSGLCSSPRGNYSFQIGAMTSSALFFNGDIAEIQLFDCALTSDQLSNIAQILADTYGVNSGVAGTLLAWGDNSAGQTNVPAGLTNSVTAACGGSFNLALDNGVVTAWGNNSAGQINVPAGLTNVAALAAGGAFSLALAEQTPTVSDLSTSGFVNHDLTLTLFGSDPDGNQLSFRIASLPVSGTLYQFAAGARGPVLNATNTLVTDAAAQLIFAPAPDETGSPYATFSFFGEDQFYRSKSAQVVVNIQLPVVPQFTAAFWNQTDTEPRMFQLTFMGSSNASYGVWASTNLLNWMRLGMVTNILPGLYQFGDMAATNWPQRFYRIAAP